MKNLKDIILEKLKVTKREIEGLDIDDTDTVIEFLTGDDIKRRQIAIDTIREEVISCGCKRMLSTNKIKHSGSYFMEFSKLHLNSEKPDRLLMLCQRKYDEYYIIAINADDNVYNKRISIMVDSWNRIQPGLAPKTAEMYQISLDCPVYEICKILESKKF